jgi:hypothetical protein
MRFMVVDCKSGKTILAAPQGLRNSLYTGVAAIHAADMKIYRQFGR